MAIPRIIHYCWFGDTEPSKNAQKCIASWEKKCPSFKIKLWTEKDLDINSNIYTKQAYEAKAWGFVPDYLRLWIIYNYGGIYLDTDVQVIKDLSPLLVNKAFAGIEPPGYVALGLGFGAEAHHPFILEHMNLYNNLTFINADGTLNKTPSPNYTTDLLIAKGFQPTNTTIQDIAGVRIYPADYFCPKSFTTGLTNISKNTYSIHHYDSSWFTEEEQQAKYARWAAERMYYYRYAPNRFLRRMIGDKTVDSIKRVLKWERSK